MRLIIALTTSTLLATAAFTKTEAERLARFPWLARTFAG